MFSIKRVVIPSRNQNMAMENALPSYNDVPCHIYKCKIGSANTNLRAQRTKSKLGKSKQRPFSEAMA